MDLWLNLRNNVLVYLILQLYIIYFESVFCKYCYKDKNYLAIFFCLLFLFCWNLFFFLKIIFLEIINKSSFLNLFVETKSKTIFKLVKFYSWFEQICLILKKIIFRKVLN